MGLREFLFGNAWKLITDYHDATLGSMVWCQDSEAWIGEYAGLGFEIAYDRAMTPTEHLLSYARAMLSDREALDAAVKGAKREAQSEYPHLAHETANLKLGTLCFYNYKGSRQVLANLNGIESDRSWRIEFTEYKCVGIGCDT